ncbi:MAG: carbohydrate-binding domain-containing protein, partial [Lachnospiraceae bacterium]|nr:carbohydrate-binding domain-containing protein [Lachnospiraceae bacterium]
MKKEYLRKVIGTALVMAVMASMTACSGAAAAEADQTGRSTAAEETAAETAEETADISEEKAGDAALEETSQKTVSETAADLSDYFTDRDMEQSADLTDAVIYEVKDGEDITITEEGVYLLKGEAAEVTVIVEADDEAKVQLVLDGVTVTNTDAPVIYVKSADKVFVTTTDSENSLSVSGSFTADGDTNTDAVIFSKDDLVMNGTGTLNISSSDNGISSKDALKITGGTLNVTSSADALEANDGIYVADGAVTIDSGKDGFHAGDSDDDTIGEIYIGGGSVKVNAADDGIQGTTVVRIAGGTIDVAAAEGIEGTDVEIGGGTITIQASDDGINASAKSSACPVTLVINGGSLTVSMAAGDTDALDSNGSLYINGGTVDISAQFAFDYVTDGAINGGTVTVNGSQVTQ